MIKTKENGESCADAKEEQKRVADKPQRTEVDAQPRLLIRENADENLSEIPFHIHQTGKSEIPS